MDGTRKAVIENLLESLTNIVLVVVLKESLLLFVHLNFGFHGAFLQLESNFVHSSLFVASPVATDIKGTHLLP